MVAGFSTLRVILVRIYKEISFYVVKKLVREKNLMIERDRGREKTQFLKANNRDKIRVDGLN